MAWRPKIELPDQYSMRYDDEFEVWTSPFIMQTVNKRVVQRSAALLPTIYGNDFAYAECSKERSRFASMMSTFGLFILGFCLFFPPVRGPSHHSH